MKELMVRDLRQALIGVPDDIPVRLDSDSGVDQGLGEITVECARRVKYGSEDYFSIYANDHADSEEVDVSPEEYRHFSEMVDEADEILKKYRDLVGEESEDGAINQERDDSSTGEGDCGMQL